jgi:hypothetical protein
MPERSFIPQSSRGRSNSAGVRLYQYVVGHDALLQDCRQVSSAAAQAFRPAIVGDALSIDRSAPYHRRIENVLPG